MILTKTKKYGKQPIKDSIAVLPELYNDDISSCLGVCSDNISKYKNDYLKKNWNEFL